MARRPRHADGRRVPRPSAKTRGGLRAAGQGGEGDDTDANRRRTSPARSSASQREDSSAHQSGPDVVLRKRAAAIGELLVICYGRDAVVSLQYTVPHRPAACRIKTVTTSAAGMTMTLPPARAAEELGRAARKVVRVRACMIASTGPIRRVASIAVSSRAAGSRARRARHGSAVPGPTCIARRENIADVADSLSFPLRRASSAARAA